MQAALRRGGRVAVTVHLPDGERVRRLPGLEVLLDGAPGQDPGRLGPYQMYHAPDEWVSGFGAPAGERFVCLRLLPPATRSP